MRALLSTYELPWDLEPVVGLAMAGECDRSVVTGVMPIGVWR
jgi:hypothetical protein